MGSLLIKNAEIVTLDAEGTIFHDTDILIENTRITRIGKLPADTMADETIDASGHVLLPGFFNAHG